MIKTNQSSIVKVVDEHLIIQNTIDKLKNRMNKTKKFKYIKELFDIIDFEFSFFEQITQTITGLSERVSCRELILDNLITANCDLFEKKIEGFLKKITKTSKSHHQVSKKFNELKQEYQLDLFFPGGYSLKSIITNDDIISRIKNKQQIESIGTGMASIANIYRKGNEHHCSSMVNISVPYKKNIIRPLSVTQKNKTNNTFIKQITNTIENINKDKEITVNETNYHTSLNEKKTTTSWKLTTHKNNNDFSNIIPNNSNKFFSSSSIEERLLMKFHSIVNSYNNESHQSTDTSKTEKKITQAVIKQHNK